MNRSLLLKEYSATNWLQFYWCKSFFSSENWQKNWEILNHFSYFFLLFFFFLVLDKFLSLLWLAHIVLRASIALIGKEFYSALCFLVLLKIPHKVFLVFFNSICFWMPFLLFLKFLWRLWKFRLHNSYSRCVVESMGNFLLQVVYGILPAMFFLITLVGVNFEAGNDTRDKF